MITKKFKLKGMHCQSCESLIKDVLSNIDGIKNIDINFTSDNASITFDSKKVNFRDIVDEIHKLDYICEEYELCNHDCNSCSDDNYNSIHNKTSNKNENNSIFYSVLVLFGILFILFMFYKISMLIPMPDISSNVSYGLLFVIGLITSFHCVAMCGPFVISYTTKNDLEKRSNIYSHFQYGFGKLLSYTFFGGVFGFLGSLFILTPFMRSIAGIIAGLFLIFFGLSMLDFSLFKKFRIRMPNLLPKKNINSPLIIGLLNGLMIICGPLQAMYVLAASTGNILEGAKLLFIFGLGTLPLMLGFGFLINKLSKSLTHKILKFSGILVIILGLIMLSNGLSLNSSINGFSNTFSKTSNEGNKINLVNGYQEIYMNVTAYGWEPNSFVIQNNVPVKWIIDGQRITGCNKAIIVPNLDLEFDIKKGIQVIEFTPTKTGNIPFSCWMGMIDGNFLVVDNNLNSNSNNQYIKNNQVANNVNQKTVGSCGGCSKGKSCGLSN